MFSIWTSPKIRCLVKSQERKERNTDQLPVDDLKFSFPLEQIGTRLISNQCHKL